MRHPAFSIFGRKIDPVLGASTTSVTIRDQMCGPPANSSGTLAQTYTYDAFGNTTNSSGSVTNFFRYAGREFDTETGLYFNRARYYDSTVGRFVSEDPMRFAASVNFYAYVGNSTLNATDPTGLASSCDSNCMPSRNLPPDLQLKLDLMSLASRLTGVTYYVGLQGGYTLTKGGFGFSGTASAGFATDPQGNKGIVISLGGAATVGTPGGGGGLQIGAATYQNISGFAGNSFGKEGNFGRGVVVGGGYSTNSSGLFTYANIGAAMGKNYDYSQSTISNGVIIMPICP